MAGTSVKLDWKFPDIKRSFEKNFKRIEVAIVSAVQYSVGRRFDYEGAYHGHPKWKPIKRDGQILTDKGKLRGSIAPLSTNGKAGPEGFINSNGDPLNSVIEVGTKVKYASIHDQGEIVSIKASTKLFKIQAGEGSDVRKFNEFASAKDVERYQKSMLEGKSGARTKITQFDANPTGEGPMNKRASMRKYVITEREIPEYAYTMPRRNFTDQNAEDEAEIAKTIENIMVAIIEGNYG